MALLEPCLRVMLVDDHAVVRSGTRLLLEQDPRFTVVLEAECGESALRGYSELRPDVVVLDLNLPGISGFEVTRQLLKGDPSANILLFSIHDEQGYVVRALDAGAKGYLSKSCASSEILEAVWAVGGGAYYPDQGGAGRSHQRKVTALDPLTLLTPREFEVFQLLAKGAGSKEIAQTLGWSLKTASNYTLALKEKLCIGSTSELVLFAAAWSRRNGAMTED